MTNPLSQICTKRSASKRTAALGLATLVFVGLSFSNFAQAEPTLNQVYEAVQAGKLDEAQTMMQQVLVARPNSAKAHFVQAEISAKRGKFDRAREELATAEKLAPGLPFAKAESVAQLRTQLAGTVPSAPASSNSVNNSMQRAAQTQSPMQAPAAPASSFPWAMALGLGGIAALGAFLVLRRRAATSAQTFTPNMAQSNSFPNNATPNNGAMGSAPFGNGTAPGYQAPGNGFGQSAGSGLGGRVAGGLATGLAVGAGMMAAQALGRNLMGDHDQNNAANKDAQLNNGNNATPLANNNDVNSDAGGQNFGISDNSSWDDAGSSGGDSGGGWDN
jgi:uncharacterized protein